MVKKRNTGNIALYIVMMIGLVILSYQMMKPAAIDKRYSEVLNLFETQQVTEYKLDFNTNLLEYTVVGNAEVQTYTVPDVNLFVNDVKPYIEAYNAANPAAKLKYTYVPRRAPSVILSLLPYILMFGAACAVLYYMYMQSNANKNVGKAQIKTASEDWRKAKFNDVAGCDEEKEELQELVEFLKNPGKFAAFGAKIPRGALLVGPPGTGKTLLARATAGEADVPFYSMSGSDFVEMYVGVGASRVRDLFKKARRTAPCIIFIDEIDAVGRQRGAGLGGGHDEREQTLNQLLVEMDGFTGKEGVIVLAATNRSDILDRALLRPGRFDRQIYVGYPDVVGREEIFKVHSRNKPIGPDVDFKVIARLTPGTTGADIENMMNEAALLAVKAGRKAITAKDINDASLKIMIGPEKKSRKVTQHERKLTAYHEAGHAIASFVGETGDTVHEVSIVPRGMAGGYTLSVPESDNQYTTKNEMFENIIVLLGGRVAEKLKLSDISTGASSDLQRVTKLARDMVMRFGFSDAIGSVVYGHDQSETFLGRDFSANRDYSEQMSAKIDEEVRHIVDEAYAKCEATLKKYDAQLEVCTQLLLERDKISGVEFKKIMDGTITSSDQLEDKGSYNWMQEAAQQLEQRDLEEEQAKKEPKPKAPKKKAEDQA